MAKASILTKNSQKSAQQDNEALSDDEDLQTDSKSRGGKGGLNPYMLRLTPAMVTHPHLIEVKRGSAVDSFDFALAKLDSTIVRPLGFNSEEEWLTFARQLFPYRQRQEQLRSEEQANKILQDLGDNPVMLQRVAQLAAERLATQKTPAGHNGMMPIHPPVFGEEHGQPTPLEMARYS